ncbi:hypothetical protein JOM56_000773 [Amanita muscaria]
MPLTTVDGSSAVSESQKVSITSRDGGVCILCGMDPIDVAHIVARKSGDQGRVDWIRHMAPTLSNFKEDDPSNLICLCPTHHRQYDSGRFVLVPSKQQRELLLEHEHRNFAMREEILARGGGDPGRTLPHLIDEFEYIPIQAGPFRMHIHNPTPYDPYIFAFDNTEHRASPLLHFRASHVALMVEAEPYLSSVTRVQSSKGDAAESQISTLLRLYRRQPGQYSSLTPVLSIPNNYEAFCTELEQPNTRSSARAVPSSPPVMNAPTPSISFAEVGLTPSPSTSTDVSSQPEDADVDLYAGADIQLMEYAKERSVTWEDLKNRPPLFGGEEVGPWRFATIAPLFHDPFSSASYAPKPTFTIRSYRERPVRVHLSHIVFELLKNSLRAVVERFGVENEDGHPPIRVVVVEGKEDITIKISDEGDGIPRSA